MSRSAALAVFAAVATLVACGDGSPSDPTGDDPPTPTGEDPGTLGTPGTPDCTQPGAPCALEVGDVFVEDGVGANQDRFFAFEVPASGAPFTIAFTPDDPGAQVNVSETDSWTFMCAIDSGCCVGSCSLEVISPDGLGDPVPGQVIGVHVYSGPTGGSLSLEIIAG